MTASQQAKQAGLSGLSEASRITKVPLSTLNDWYRSRPSLFRALLIGANIISKE